MIQGKCIVQKREHYNNVWPEIFGSVPRVGEYVRGSGGLELRVKKVVHYTKTLMKAKTNVIAPMIEVHLEDDE